MRTYSFISNYLQSSGWELAKKTEVKREGNTLKKMAVAEMIVWVELQSGEKQKSKSPILCRP